MAKNFGASVTLQENVAREDMALYDFIQSALPNAGVTSEGTSVTLNPIRVMLSSENATERKVLDRLEPIEAVIDILQAKSESADNALQALKGQEGSQEYREAHNLAHETRADLSKFTDQQRSILMDYFGRNYPRPEIGSFLFKIEKIVKSLWFAPKIRKVNGAVETQKSVIPWDTEALTVTVHWDDLSVTVTRRPKLKVGGGRRNSRGYAMVERSHDPIVDEARAMLEKMTAPSTETE